MNRIQNQALRAELHALATEIDRRTAAAWDQMREDSTNVESLTQAAWTEHRIARAEERGKREGLMEAYHIILERVQYLARLPLEPTR